jgi:hypothetical protein
MQPGKSGRAQRYLTQHCQVFVISGVCMMSFAKLNEARCSYGTDEDAILVYVKSWT